MVLLDLGEFEGLFVKLCDFWGLNLDFVKL